MFRNHLRRIGIIVLMLWLWMIVRIPFIYLTHPLSK